MTTKATSLRTMNQKVGLGLGAIYLLMGLAGFAVTRGVGFAQVTGSELVILELNALHNIVHVLIGLALGGAALVSGVASRAMNAAVGGTYLLVGVVGLFLVGTDANILALNQPDNALHFLTAAALLAVAVRKEAATD